MTEIAVDQRHLARWRNAIIAAFAMGGITVSAWGPRLPTISADMHLSPGAIGVLVAFGTVGSIVGLFLSTPLLHWLGGRRGVASALVTIACGLAIMAFGVALRSTPVMAFGFIVMGMATGILDVFINVEGSAVERRAKRTLMPLMHSAWSVGAAIGSGIGAACAALGVTPAQQFFGEAVLIAVVGIVVAPLIPLGARQEPEAGPERTRREAFRQYLRGWTDWRLLLIGVVLLGVELGEGSANNWLTLGVKQDHGQTAAVAALFFTAFAAGEAATRMFGGPVVDRLGRANTIRVTTAIGVVGLALFILGGNPALVLVGVLLWAVGVSMGFPLGMSAAAEGGGNPAARVSVIASIGYAASLAGPPVIGALADSVGLLNAMWLLVALMIAAFAAAGALAVRKERV
ncbi:MAG: MFS transporter [Microbacteriaceae bacterium]|nr:MFS transporter [Microbacteriaceae bacterium]MCL2795158.1 MFS transporter [Microbacteriaceae bacterium]